MNKNRQIFISDNYLFSMAAETKVTDEKSTLPNFEKEYRLPTESKQQWDLRKRFLEAFWNKYDEDRLLCLARSYILIFCF